MSFLDKKLTEGMVPEGFETWFELSTTGLYYEDEDVNGRIHAFFVRWQETTTWPPFIPSSNPTPTICSSTRGLFVCRDADSRYHVYNPFNVAVAGHYSFPAPPRSHRPETSSILAIDLSDIASPFLILVCAIPQGRSVYTFDVYSSLRGSWVSLENVVLPLGGFLLSNTGVSCHDEVYWLVDKPAHIIRFNSNGCLLDPLRLPEDLVNVHVNSAQLGRAGGNLLLVCVNLTRSRVEAYILQGNDEFVLTAHLDVQINSDDFSDENWWCAGRYRILCREMPRPIRSESWKMQIILLVDEWAVLWENSSTDPSRHRFIVTTQALPDSCARGAAYVCSSLTPWQFIRNELTVVEGSRHIAWMSTCGIFNRDNNGGTQFLHFPSSSISHLPPLFNPFIDPSPELCASSSGLVLFRRSTPSQYYIANPFIHGAYSPLPSPTRNHPTDCVIILSTDLSTLNFYVLCIVREGWSEAYKFDVFTSTTGVWDTDEHSILEGPQILADSGSSAGRFAYWLMAQPIAVGRYDPLEKRLSNVQLPDALFSPGIVLRLGKVLNKLGLVAVNEATSKVELYTVNDQETGFELFTVLNFALTQLTSWESCSNWWNEGRLMCREIPRAIRFESHMVEVPLLVHGRVLVWDSFANAVTLLPTPARKQVARGLPYVFTPFRPQHFLFLNKPQ